MSFIPSQQSIDPFKLFKETLAQVGPVYIPLLIISSPDIIFAILRSIVPPSLELLVVSVFTFVITPIISGVSIYFCHRYLKYGTIDLAGSVETTLGQSVQLILGFIIYAVAMLLGLICLVIPGIYIAVRFHFVLNAILSENCSAIEGLNYSSRLVAGRWWAVFGSMLVTVVLIIIPAALSIVAVNVASVERPLIGLMISLVINALVQPIVSLYFNKLYIRLQDLINHQPAFE
jgi:hypothetical protein